MSRAPRPAVLSLTLAAALVSAASPAAAQWFHGGPDQKDLVIDAAARKRVLDAALDRIREGYVFPEKAKDIAKVMRRHESAHEYDRITSAKEYADSLTAHLQAVTHDKHLRVFYSEQPIPEAPPEDEGQGPDPARMAAMEAQMRRRNFGFEKMERLAGNVGYLELRQFAPAAMAGPLVESAMRFVANTDALIIDLRRNGGGDGTTVAMLCTYFVQPHGRQLLNTVIIPREKLEMQSWTLPFVEGDRYVDKPVYILTGAGTFSAAEEFAYNMQSMKRAKTVGEPSGGGAHPVQPERLAEHFELSLPWARSENPETRTNWEGTGVQPDIAVPADEALAKAHHLAAETLLAAATDPEQRQALQQTLKDLDAGIAPGSAPREP